MITPNAAAQGMVTGHICSMAEDTKEVPPPAWLTPTRMPGALSSGRSCGCAMESTACAHLVHLDI